MTEQTFCGLCKNVIIEFDPPEIEYQGGWYDVHPKCKEEWERYNSPENIVTVYKTDFQSLYEYDRLQDKKWDLMRTALEKDPEILARASKRLEEFEKNLMVSTPRQHGKTHALKEFRKYFDNDSKLTALSASQNQSAKEWANEYGFIIVDDVIPTPSKKKPNKRSPKKRKTIFDNVKEDEQLNRKQRNKQRKMSKLRYS
ncbi:MAG: hypothetical protein ACXAC2_00540 [Candidatus Kariarchaeaceae archaeon]|jgi:hypothetical protein